jgi:hypothetical protein
MSSVVVQFNSGKAKPFSSAVKILAFILGHEMYGSKCSLSNHNKKSKGDTTGEHKGLIFVLLIRCRDNMHVHYLAEAREMLKRTWTDRNYIKMGISYVSEQDKKYHLYS